MTERKANRTPKIAAWIRERRGEFNFFICLTGNVGAERKARLLTIWLSQRLKN